MSPNTGNKLHGESKPSYEDVQYWRVNERNVALFLGNVCGITAFNCLCPSFSICWDVLNTLHSPFDTSPSRHEGLSLLEAVKSCFAKSLGKVVEADHMVHLIY